MSFAFNFSAEAAQNAGISPFINEGGAYAGTLTEVKATHGQNGSQSEGIEFGLSTPHGDAPYLSIYVTKRDGTINNQGYAMVCAMLAITRCQVPQNASMAQIAELLNGKPLGLVLQKVLQMKGDGVTETFKMDVKQAFLPANGCTAKELYAKAPAKEVNDMLATLTVRDQRNHARGGQATQQAQGGGQTQQNTAATVDQDLGW